MITIYSWEIKDYLETRGYSLTREEYNALDYKDNPQISRVSYDTFNNKFIIKTSDGYTFDFEVRNK